MAELNSGVLRNRVQFTASTSEALMARDVFSLLAGPNIGAKPAHGFELPP